MTDLIITSLLPEAKRREREAMLKRKQPWVPLQPQVKNSQRWLLNNLSLQFPRGRR